MALKLEDKKAIVAEVAKVAANSLSAVAAEYRGLTVEEMTELRVEARKQGIYMRVVRNTLACRALTGTEFQCMNDALVGPLVLAFSQKDPGAAARLIRGFSKGHEKLVAKVLSINGKLLPGKDINLLADLPTQQEALTLVVVVMKAPITQMVRTCAEPYAKLVRAMAAIRDQKQAA